MGFTLCGDAPGLDVLGGGIGTAAFEDDLGGDVGTSNFSVSFGGIAGNAKLLVGNIGDSCFLESTEGDCECGGETGPFHFGWIPALLLWMVFTRCTGDKFVLGTLRGGTNAAVLGLMATG